MLLLLACAPVPARGDGSLCCATGLRKGMSDSPRLVKAFRDLRVPRHLFKFMYRLLIEHGNAHTDENPAWKIRSETCSNRSWLSILRDQDQVDRGLRAG